MMAVDVSLDYGRIIATGTAGDDYIRAYTRGDTIEVRTYTDKGPVTIHQFDRSQVRAISIAGMDGNDNLDNDLEVMGRLYGGEGDDRIAGTDRAEFGDEIWGGPGNDFLWGLRGNDTLVGGEGDDVLIGGPGDDRMIGQAGHDRLYGDEGSDELLGGDGFDRIWGGDGDDRIEAGEGDDSVAAGYGDDIILGGDGDDRLYGEFGNDEIYGGEGHDRLFGYYGDDRLYGGGGYDVLSGSSGDDALFGGVNGHDEIWSGPGDDRILIMQERSQTPIFGISEWRTWTSIEDLDRRRDARLFFRNLDDISSFSIGGERRYFGSGEFDNYQVQRIDEAFELVHRRTGNTNLLKKASGREMAIYALGRQIGTSDGMMFDSFNDGGRIFLTQHALKGPNFGVKDHLVDLVLHELAHNWDARSEVGGWATDFRRLSGWTQKRSGGLVVSGDGKWLYDPQASFAEDKWMAPRIGTFTTDHATFSPYDDVATMWVQYFNGGRAALTQRLPEFDGTLSKLALLDELFNTLA